MFLLNFWKGGIAPGEVRYHPHSEYAKAYKAMERCEDHLKNRLSQEDYAVFAEFKEAVQDAGILSDCDNFIDGFRMGAQMMMDVLAT